MGRLLRVRGKRVGMLAAVAVIAVVGGAYAAANVAGTITVCVRHNGGALYRARHCAARDGTLSWNARGPKGPKGATGQMGPKGDTGAQGPGASSFRLAFTDGQFHHEIAYQNADYMLVLQCEANPAGASIQVVRKNTVEVEGTYSHGPYEAPGAPPSQATGTNMVDGLLDGTADNLFRWMGTDNNNSSQGTGEFVIGGPSIGQQVVLLTVIHAGDVCVGRGQVIPQS